MYVDLCFIYLYLVEGLFGEAAGDKSARSSICHQVTNWKTKRCSGEDPGMRAPERRGPQMLLLEDT